jgi:hypothetical protein
MGSILVCRAPCWKSWFFTFSAVFLVIFAWSFTSDLNIGDESWFLQVVHRVNQGEVLYRDIFFGATPVSVYLSCFVVKLFGTQILVLKALNTGIFVLTAMLCCKIANKISWQFLLILAVFYFPLCSNSVYSPLANLFFIGCLYSMLKWIETDYHILYLIGASCFAALCFGTKQNMGILALLCVLSSLYMKRKKFKKNTIFALLLFALVGLFLLIPILISGGWEGFLDYAFLNKVTYLQKGQLSYFSKVNFSSMRSSTLFLLPVFAISGLVWKIWKTKTHTCRVLLIFCLGSFFSVFPRMDDFHLAIAVPICLIGFLYSIKEFPKVASYVIVGLCLYWTIPQTEQLYHTLKGKRKMLTLSHFYGVWVDPSCARFLQDRIDFIQQHLHGNETVFILSPYAGFYYLALDLPNQTPFDYPLVTTFGRGGEEKMTLRIASGEFQRVFFDHAMNDHDLLRSHRISDYVTQHMHAKESLTQKPDLVLYRTQN